MPTRWTAASFGSLALMLSLSSCPLEGDPPKELPDQLELPEGTLFSVDTETSMFELRVAGAPELSLAAVLTDSHGRRRIELRDGSRSPTLVRSARWVLLAAGAASGDTLCVCWSELSGSPSSLTVGALPDPTEGLDLFCRFQTSEGWSEPVELAPEAPAAWLQGVEPLGESFRVHYRRDEGWLVVDGSEDDGSYSRVVEPGSPPGPPERTDL